MSATPPTLLAHVEALRRPGDTAFEAAERELVRLALVEAEGVLNRAAFLLSADVVSVKHRVLKYGLGALVRRKSAVMEHA